MCPNILCDIFRKKNYDLNTRLDGHQLGHLRTIALHSHGVNSTHSLLLRAYIFFVLSFLGSEDFQNEIWDAWLCSLWGVWK